MTKTKIIFAAIAAITITSLLLATNSLTGISALTASSPCPADGTVEHWDKIIFEVKKDKNDPKLTAVREGSIFDIKVIDDPNSVVDLKALAKAKLVSAFGITQAQASKLDIDIRDVEYQIASCGNQGTQGIQGEQGPQGIQGEQGPAGTSDITDLELRIDALENAFASINKVPTVDAGVDQTITGVILPAGCTFGLCVPESLSCTTTLAGVASDDGLNQPLTTTWKVTGTASFDPSDLNTPITFVIPSSTPAFLSFLQFELEVNDGFYTVTDTVQINCNHP